MNTKTMLAAAFAVAASITAASAANFSVSTVGVVNTNGHTIIDATGSISDTTFASDIATAFAADTGGVWNFDINNNFSVDNGETVTLSYGTSQSNSLVMTLSGLNINTGFVTTTEATSGSTGLGLGSDASTRTFTLGTNLQTLGIFVGNRGDNSRTSVLTVTFLDDTTASTSGATAGPTSGSNYFEGLSATGTNYIKSFSIAQSAFIRYDDLGFVAAPVPEPTTFACLVGGVGMLALLRRRRA